LSDDTGVIEHAWHEVPRRQCGYNVDDAARALIVVCRETQPTARLVALAERCLAFLYHARRSDGRLHNELSYAREWIDDVGSDDCHGRALWALGIAALDGPSAAIRRGARRLFEVTAGLDSEAPRSNAFAILGAAHVLGRAPADRTARAVLRRCASRLPVPCDDPAWPWYEARLSYDNARLPQARMLAGRLLEAPALEAEGLARLEWLVDVERNAGHFSFTPVGGWRAGETRPAFDQQPVEAAAMVDACVTALELTAETIWTERAREAAAWFVGKNDIGVSLYDPETGGCRDGLECDDVNRNQGAESTLACISALQQAARLERGLDRHDPERLHQLELVDDRRPNGAIGGAIG
jgi:hypothetical protein